MQLTKTDNHSEILRFIYAPPPEVRERLNKFYSKFDGVCKQLDDWYCPRVELPHLLMLDLCLRKVKVDLHEWVDWRISTLSVAQHIFINDQNEVWDPLKEPFNRYMKRSNGGIKAIRQRTNTADKVWRLTQGDTCCQSS